MNFPKFSESKGILKFGRSEVCVSGGSSRVGLLNQEYVYIYIYGIILENSCLLLEDAGKGLKGSEVSF